MLKLQGNPYCFYTFTFGNDNLDNKIIKFHLYLNKDKKVMTIYYNTFNKQMYCRYQVNDIGRLQTHSKKIFITKETLTDVLNKIIMLY